MPPLRTVLLTLSRSQRLKKMAARFGPAWAVARRFVAGETLDDAISAVRTLKGQGLRATLDHLGESVAREDQACAATADVVKLLNALEAAGLEAGVSVKLTQLGLNLNRALAADNAEQIVARASEMGRFVWIDMENFPYVQPTLDLFEALCSAHKNVGAVVQAYLYRSQADVAHLVTLGAAVRLVKGAYDEPPEVAFPRKADTDANYVRLMEILFGEAAQSTGVFPAIATHDSRLIAWAKEHAAQRGIARDGFEFQMLYGIRPALQRQLAAEGYNVRAYVPYGREWYPYFMRRLAERPANLLFFVRSLVKR